MSEGRLFVVVLAGGSGSRLWPLSRSHKPKQLLTLTGEHSLIRTTVERVLPLVPPERVLVMTEQSHAEGVAAELPDVPAENIFVEPARRGTAGSLALAAAAIHQRRPDAVMASVHSDAFIDDADEFRRTLSAAFAAADESRYLVLMGIPPAFPSTDLGYIEAGDDMKIVDGYQVRRVARFVEKPGLEPARRFSTSGRHFWNPGVFVWRTDVILDEFGRLQPAIIEKIDEIAASLGTVDQDETIRRVYPSVPSESIDVGIMEKSDRVAVIPAKFGWSDIGSWGELLSILPRDADDNVVHGSHVGLGTRNSLIYATSRTVATVGLENLVVVETPDVILICPRERSQDVKKLVELLVVDPSRQDLL